MVFKVCLLLKLFIFKFLLGGDAKKLEGGKEYLNGILLDIKGKIRLSFLKNE